MSGPKTSRYILTPEQRRILAEQRRIERRRAAASENIKRVEKKLRELGSLDSGRAVADELSARYGNDGGYSQKFDELRALTVTVAAAVAAADNTSVDSLEKTSKTVGDCLAKAERLTAELSAIATKNDVMLRESLSADIDKGFETSFAAIKTAEDKCAELRTSSKIQLLTVRNAAVLPTSYIVEIERIITKLDSITDEAFLKNYISLTVTPLVEKCHTYLKEYDLLHDEYDALNTEYISLCGLYYLVAQEYSCSADSIEKLKAEIERIKKNADEDDEQSYISEALDEVMEEMGYSVLGSREVTKKNGRHFRNELYSYADGTVVNVTFSADGKIAMELGGADTSDRLPDEHETEYLCSQMESFCDDFKYIEKLLSEKGVVLRERISLLPPEAANAQIINTSDYSLSGDVESIKVKRNTRKKTALKTKEAN